MNPPKIGPGGIEEILLSRRWRAVLAAALIGVVALVDWRVELDVAFGFLYVFPLILLGTVLPRWGIVVVALICTTLADLFDPYPFSPVSVPHDILVFISLAGTGFFAHAVTRSRRLAMEAEEQFEFFVNTSPAAILTMTDAGEILLANGAAHRLFRAAPGALLGRNIRGCVPALAHIPARTENGKTIQSAMQCRGVRDTGEGFLADVFFSTYKTALGPRLAGVIIDVSEALRERELSGLDQLLAGSRILVGAMFHEVRNMCSAMAINYETLVRNSQLTENKNFEALGALISTLARVAAAGLEQRAKDSEATAVDLVDVVTDLRLVLDPYCEEAEIELHWDIPARLPPVWIDRHRLLQVFLNLMRNSERALADRETKRIDVAASVTGDLVSIRVTDSGPGLVSADHLFEPFQQGAEATGLGLYLSRALLRSFRGDLRYDPTVPGCSFVIELTMIHSADERVEHDGGGEEAGNAGRATLTGSASQTSVHGTNPIIVG
ncbi:MAG TPA: ATP-binding protein [Vicinamibacterales bacterium]|jgi:two-component system sensor kinase FixL|nr:ATP-binding protein [Vicinamibacterales bacterium]